MPVETVPELVRQYQDSLLLYKAKLDSVEKENSLLGARMDPRMYKLYVRAQRMTLPKRRVWPIIWST